MRTHALKYFRSTIPIGFVCLAAVLTLSSCSKKPQQAILGKWADQNQPSVVDFRSDGTVLTTAGGKTTSAKYKFVDDSHMEIEMNGTVGTNNITLQMTCAVTIKGDSAELAVQVPQRAGEPPRVETMRFKRSK